MSKLKAYKYRLYPTSAQAETLQGTLDLLRELYNAAIQERRDADDLCVKRHPNYYDEATRKQLTRDHAISYYQQADQLPEIKERREEFQDIHSQVLQDMLRRVKKTFDAFFGRVREGKTPGFPRYKGKDHFDSFCYPQFGFSLTADRRLCLSKRRSLMAVPLKIRAICGKRRPNWQECSNESPRRSVALHAARKQASWLAWCIAR